MDITFGAFELILLIVLFILFGGVILRIGGMILYGLIILVGIVFFLRVLQVLI